MYVSQESIEEAIQSQKKRNPKSGKTPKLFPRPYKLTRRMTPVAYDIACQVVTHLCLKKFTNLTWLPFPLNAKEDRIIHATQIPAQCGLGTGKIVSATNGGYRNRSARRSSIARLSWQKYSLKLFFECLSFQTSPFFTSVRNGFQINSIVYHFDAVRFRNRSL